MGAPSPIQMAPTAQAARALGAPSLGAPPVGAPLGPAQARAGASEITIGTFNVLGASHTDGGGKTHPGFGSSASRLPKAIDSLRKAGVEVAGMQEFQASQQRDFKSKAREFDMFAPSDNAVVWKRDTFKLVEKRTLKVPYFGGKPKEMPVVMLEHRQTGQRAWFINIHNPTTNKRQPGNDGHRAEALRRERALMQQLQASGLPVYLVGDFNDRAKARESITSVPGATASAPRSERDRIDWIFGTGPQRFTDHRVIEQRGISDHPLVVAKSQL